jgi:hypothetical protein
MGSQPKSQSIQKIFFCIRLCRAFAADHFGKKTFRISLRNGDVVVKIFIAKSRRYQSFFIGISYTMFNRDLFILFACI